MKKAVLFLSFLLMPFVFVFAQEKPKQEQPKEQPKPPVQPPAPKQCVVMLTVEAWQAVTVALNNPDDLSVTYRKQLLAEIVAQVNKQIQADSTIKK